MKPMQQHCSALPCTHWLGPHWSHVDSIPVCVQVMDKVKLPLLTFLSMAPVVLLVRLGLY